MPNLQDATKQTPYQLFTSMTEMINKKHWRPFGCPVFVLEEQLQSGHPFQKWRQQARVGIYLGQSPIHNRNVALVLHRNMGHVSPQFHVKFDPGFHTMQQDKLDCTWQQATCFIPSSPEKQQAKQTKPPKQASDTRQGHNSLHEANKIPQGLPMEKDHINESVEPKQHDKPTEPATMTKQQQLQGLKVQKQSEHVPVMHSPQVGPSLHRVKTVPQCLIELMYTKIEQQEILGELLSFSSLFPHDTTMDMPNNQLLAFNATNSDPDTMYHHQAMRQPGRAQFMGSMQKEMDSQLDYGNSEIVHRSTISTGSKVFPAIWQMR